ncbi:hypothetical protein EV383_4480 [Pseudonocardia sediminis]|uniref:Uncharacterized protein n=1 Tax=Pseudonocardia sediminis TaxID=1397368 RepID=A0A4Q7V0F0_PSEST|nr:hypothetical protein EV383_4480 [Pseudonocardia sediminis]
MGRSPGGGDGLGFAVFLAAGGTEAHDDGRVMGAGHHLVVVEFLDASRLAP